MSAAEFTSALVGHMAELEEALPGVGSSHFSQMRTRAHDRLKNRGFPTARDEEWRYTNLGKLQQNIFTAPIAGGDAGSTIKLDLPVSANSTRLVFVNGSFSASLSRPPKAVAGATIRPLAEALDGSSTLLEEHLGTGLPKEPHGFTCANTAYFRDGAFIHLEKNTVLDEPLELVFVTFSSIPVVAHPRNFIYCGQGSSATVVERHISTQGPPGLNNPVTEIFADQGAALDHYKIQDEQDQGFHTGGIFIRQGRESRVTSNNICLGSLLARTDLTGSLDGEGAELTMNGIAVGAGRQHIDNCTEVLHSVAACTSDEFYKSILNDRSRSVFRGRIIVAQDAQQTNANQQSRNLLLSSLCEADVKPQLEIYADDVQCSHGATVGQLDALAIYYLRTRGLDIDTARQILTLAFANEVIDRLALPSIRDELSKRMAGRLLPDLDGNRV